MTYWWVIVLVLALPGALIILASVIGFIFRRPGKTNEPVIPAPGYWRVLGVDKQTGQKRETMFHADSQQSAQGRAELEGIVVTEIQQVDESLSD